MLLSCHAVQAIILSDAMKKALESATNDFEAKLKLLAEESGTEKVDIRPITITHHAPLLSDGTVDFTWELYITYPFILWDPLTHYKDVYKSSPVICPLCLTNGLTQETLFRVGEWFNGRKKRSNPRIVFGTYACVLLVSCVYRCAHGHEISACHPAILDKLEDRTNIPFFLTHKNGFMLDLAILVEDLIDAGLSFDQVENLIERQYKTTYDHFEKNFWRDLELSTRKGIAYDKNKHFFPAFSSENFPCPGNDILIDIFLKRFLMNEQLYLRAMNSLAASAISCDHTFKSACNIGYKRAEDGKWIKQYNSIFCVINERGEIISWQFTKSEGFSEVKDLFLDIKKRFDPNSPTNICIDNCCKWRSLLEDIFPESTIKQDLFHAVQRFVKTLKKKDSVQRDIASDFGKIFRHPQDLRDIRKMPTPCKDILLSNLQNFMKKWEKKQSNGVTVLNSDRLNAISRIRSHILKDCLSNIPAQCSTSVNERLHKEMKKLLSKNRMGTQLAYAKFTRHFFKHNQQRGNRDSIYSLCAKKHKETFEKCSTVSSELGARNAHFGIRSEERESSALPLSSCSSYTIDKLTPQVMDDLLKNIEKAMSLHEISDSDFSSHSDHSYFDTGRASHESFNILKYSLSLFKIILLLKSLWSSKEINLVKIPFLFQNIETYLSSGSSSTMKKTDSSTMNDRERLGNIATSFGFTIIPITGDGNCFFRAVAFQLLQFLLSSSCPENLHIHLQSLGINNEISIKELSQRLRQIVVEEWRENPQEYIPFFENIDMQLESERFRTSGEFAGQLGDALPLAMTNVLHIPILILTTVHNMPFLPVIPRTNLNNDIVIYLSYIQEGPGHYDALISTDLPDNPENMAETRRLQPPEGKNSTK
jgi:hypothetical protein